MEIGGFKTSNDQKNPNGTTICQSRNFFGLVSTKLYIRHVYQAGELGNHFWKNIQIVSFSLQENGQKSRKSNLHFRSFSQCDI